MAREVVEWIVCHQRKVVRALRFDVTGALKTGFRPAGRRREDIETAGFLRTEKGTVPSAHQFGDHGQAVTSDLDPLLP